MTKKTAIYCSLTLYQFMFHDMSSNLYAIIKNGFWCSIVVLTSVGWTDFNGGANQLSVFASVLRRISAAQRLSARSFSDFSASKNCPSGTDVSGIQCSHAFFCIA